MGGGPKIKTFFQKQLFCLANVLSVPGSRAKKKKKKKKMIVSIIDCCRKPDLGSRELRSPANLTKNYKKEKHLIFLEPLLSTNFSVSKKKSFPGKLFFGSENSCGLEGPGFDSSSGVFHRMSSPSCSEREKERKREREKERKREREKERKREREREREKERKREREKERKREREKERKREREKERKRERKREREKERKREM